PSIPCRHPFAEPGHDPPGGAVALGSPATWSDRQRVAPDPDPRRLDPEGGAAPSAKPNREARRPELRAVERILRGEPSRPFHHPVVDDLDRPPDVEGRPANARLGARAGA